MQERLFAALTTAFGVLALILASLGIYGLMAYTVARRTNEIGMALGAQGREVLSMILREGFLLGTAGVVIGLGAAFALTRYIGMMLYGLNPQTRSRSLARGACFCLVLLLPDGCLPGVLLASSQ